MSYLPPKEVELATSVLALISDPKAAQERLEALKAASAEYTALKVSLHDQTVQNEKDLKKLEADKQVLEKGRTELETKLNTELPKLAERSRLLSLREDALNIQLNKQKQDVASFQAREAGLNAVMGLRETKVQDRENDVKKREAVALARELEVQARFDKLRKAID